MIGSAEKSEIFFFRDENYGKIHGKRIRKVQGKWLKSLKKLAVMEKRRSHV